MADVDASDMRVGLAADGKIVWANDLETGRMHWTWPSRVMDLLPLPNVTHLLKKLFCPPRQMADVDASDMRVDLAAGGHIAWANDLETGRMYWTWPSSVMDLLRPAYPGQLAKIQRNLLNLIGLVDPGTLPGLRCAPS